jgi:hypothetical protein
LKSGSVLEKQPNILQSNHTENRIKSQQSLTKDSTSFHVISGPFMSTSESITHQAAAEFFHTSLLSRQSASSRIVMQGGQAAKTIETLHSMLCETLLKDSRLARTRKLENFPKMSTILADKDGAFQITLGRGLPAESFRASFLGWLAFLRSEGVIEILPATFQTKKKRTPLPQW